MLRIRGFFSLTLIDEINEKICYGLESTCNFESYPSNEEKLLKK